VEIGHFDGHHPRSEKLWSRSAVHRAFNRFQAVDLTFRLIIAPGQVKKLRKTANVREPCLRASTFRA
jgi:hypothetical protein